MTNKEKYLDELIKIWETGHQFGVFDRKPARCDAYRCSACAFYSTGGCIPSRENWLKQEYKAVKASTLTVDTKIVIYYKDTHKINKRYFSHFANGYIYYFYAGSDSWSSYGVGTSCISESGRFTVTLEDGTPVVFE